MVTNSTNKPVQRVPCQHTRVYNPVQGWSYAHHASLVVFQGKLLAMWSNGCINEDDVGQRVLIASRHTDGSWTAPRVLIDAESSGNPLHVLTAAGMYVHKDTLIAYIGCYEYDQATLTSGGNRQPVDGHHQNTRLGYVTSKDGVQWSSIVWTNLRMIPNHGPRQTSTGRVIITGNISYPYTDDVSSLSGYTVTGIYGQSFADGVVVDDSETIHRVTKENGWDARLLCEGAFYETEDKVLHMLLRSNSRCLWCTESADDGATWSEPFPLDFTDDGSKFDVGRLPDGRYFYVGNTVVGGGRNPLMLCLSNDGIVFDTHVILRDEDQPQRFEGMHKGGLYAYPHACVFEDTLYIIHSVHKEAIDICSVRLIDISNDKLI